MTGGLFDPLGTDRAEPPRGWFGGRVARPSAPALAAASMLAAFAALLAVAWLRDSGDRGRPVAVAPIERVQAPPKPPAAPPPAPPSSALPAAPPVEAPPAGSPPGPGASARADQDVEIQNGVRVVRPRRGAAAPGGQTLSVPDGAAAR